VVDGPVPCCVVNHVASIARPAEPPRIPSPLITSAL
jgi:hypothetical protein